MHSGRFYFIKDEYFKKFDGNNLMVNKEAIDGKEHNRPCYYSFREPDSDIMWMIPISSKITKYEKVYDEKMKKYKEYDGIKFGFVLGKNHAFLIQNMCPVTEKYIKNEYIDNATNAPVIIKASLIRELNAGARKAVRLYHQGTKIVFADIQTIRESLLAELSEQNNENE
jgi:hypothetical protein